MKIQVENIKCGGCVNSITKKINANFETSSVSIDIENGIIDVDIDDNKKNELEELLLKLGYPKINSVEGLKAITSKAKSFVSCAIGKID